MSELRTSTVRSTALLLCLLLLSLNGCKERTPLITIDAADAALSPSLIGVVSVFMKITNSGNADDALVGARANLPGSVAELHDIADGKMVKVSRIAIPADSALMFRPARYHIMIYKMPKDLKEGDQFDLVLTFERSGDRTVRCEVRSFSRKLLRK